MFFFKNKNLAILLLSLFSVLDSYAQNKSGKFLVVLDAGHGGKDPGNSYHGFVEKDIALKTTLKVGAFLAKEKDFEVVFTRESDVFIELVNRPKVANKLNANLFVSIHCNSVKNYEPAGTETFVMGLSRTDMNMEVAKSENSVIFLEDNYKKTYEGFDPNKPETFLGLKILQEENLNSSINLASVIQDNFTTNLNRKTRGVKQQPLWVLDAAYMPSVLIELGFLSNREEGTFLNSDEGQTKMAKEIAAAIVSYKRENYNESSASTQVSTVLESRKNEHELLKTASAEKRAIPSTGANYKVQLFATARKRNTDSSEFKGLNDISFTYENKLFKYFYGVATTEDAAKTLCEIAKSRGFKDAFVVTF
jgi:N-acetylmuramoyl-L-alanine amidase